MCGCLYSARAYQEAAPQRQSRGDRNQLSGATLADDPAIELRDAAAT
jgi:hypothetical protein